MLKNTERLLKILNLLRNRRTVITAQALADKLDVSVRTIYRDIQKLDSAGIPIDGEAGVGYRILRRFELPPLMFDADEVEALILGVKMVRAWSDEGLAASANSALNKIVGVLPSELKDLESDMVLEVPNFSSEERDNPHSQKLREAIKLKQVIVVEYLSLSEELTQRRIWPLGVFFWGHVWTLVAWCKLREDYRVFRIDRLQNIVFEQDKFETTPAISLETYLRQIKSDKTSWKD